jgi:hypothetical protein
MNFNSGIFGLITERPLRLRVPCHMVAVLGLLLFGLVSPVFVREASATVPSLPTPPALPYVTPPPPPPALPSPLTLPSPPTVSVPAVPVVVPHLTPPASGGAPSPAPAASASGSPTAATGPGSFGRQTAPQRLRRAVLQLQGCLGALPSEERRVLTLRTGLDGGGVRSEGAVAGLLGVPISRVQRLERSGLHGLYAAAAAGGCGSLGSQSGASLLPGESGSLLSPGSTLPSGSTFAGRLGKLAAGGVTATGEPGAGFDTLFLLGLAILLLAIGFALHLRRERQRREAESRVSALIATLEERRRRQAYAQAHNPALR